MKSSPITQWSDALQQWAIPDDILAQAPQSPWIHPVSSFRPTGDLYVDTPSRLRALEALPDNGSVLDVGCGGGRGAFGLVPPAGLVIGVDHQAEMLKVFREEALQRNVRCETVEGDWPDVAQYTPTCDVVICHHVYYNVTKIDVFANELHSHAHKRVVIELPLQHPLSSLSPLWKHFWDLERPTTPTAHSALDAMLSLGYSAHLELFETAPISQEITAELVEHTRIRLCLPPDRDREIAKFLSQQVPSPRQLATIWWDTA